MAKRLPLVLGSLTLLVWAAVLVYFIASERIDHYLSSTFQIQALVGGIGLGVLGLFNLLTSGEKTAACGHDHGGEENDGGCCGHDHGQAHGHSHDHGTPKAAACGHDHDHAHEACGHDHDHGEHEAQDHAPAGKAEEPAHHHHDDETPVSLAVNYSILLIPVVAAALLTPDAFSIHAVSNNAVLGEASETVREELALGNRKRQANEATGAAIGAVPDSPPSPSDPSDPQPSDAPPAPPAEPPVDPYAFTEADLENLLDKTEAGEYKITIPEIFYTGGDAALQKVLQGKPFETTGQAMKETKANDLGNRMRVFQLFMECCAADARPLSVPVEFAAGLPDFKEMRWYRVRGSLDFEMRNDVSVPVFRASTLDEIDAPAGGNFYKPPQ